jgi:hypothetical protein
MAIAYDNATTYIATNNTSLTIHTFSHTVVSNTNGYLLVAIAYQSGSATVSSVTYNGVDMGAALKSQLTASDRTYLFGLKAPASGANDVVVTMSAGKDIVVGAVSYTGVHQTTSTGTAVQNTGTSTTISSSPSSSAGEICVDAGSTNSATNTYVANYTKRVDGECGSNTYSHIAMQETTTANPTMTYTITSDTWLSLAVPLKPVAEVSYPIGPFPTSRQDLA